MATSPLKSYQKPIILSLHKENKRICYNMIIFEDWWEAYCENHTQSIDSRDNMSLATALDFLQGMQ
jgi:hypothetical protein